MEININNQIKNISEQCSLQQLIESASGGGSQKGIAVAINNSVIPKTDWKKYFLKQNDDVLIIKATQGG